MSPAENAYAGTNQALHDQDAEPGKDRQSTEARRVFADLMSLDPEVRRLIYREHLSERDWSAVLRAAQYETGTPYGMWADDPIGFTEDIIGETTWSKQKQVLGGIPNHKRIGVPSAFGTGKTHLAGRAALWRALVYPPGTSLTITTATRFRQVQRQLWPHIRMAVAKANLPLVADMTQLKARNRDGVEVVVAYGFTAPPNDESAMQGIHAPRLFIVVDEAGGISRTIGGAMRGLLTGDDTRMLAIGNPPTDDDNSWFEQFCDDEDVYTVPISAYDAPLQSNEKTPRCRACPPEVPPHRLAKHLVDGKWISDTIEEYGEDAPYVVAKVHAKFPKGGPTRTIPADWIDLAVQKEEPLPGPEWKALSDLSEDETEGWLVKLGAWVRLGVDVAADGGDELVIARQIGDLGTIEHTSSGSVNTNAVDVAGKVLVQIKRAEKIRKALGTKARVEVKVDAIGVGWGVWSTLVAWGSEGVHDAKIVRVIVSEDTYRDDEQAVMRPYRKRDELWLTGRALLQPRAETGSGQLRLRFDKRTQAQLAAPTYGTNSQGRTVVESKKHMKQTRGVPSPDRAEAWLLTIYQPLNKDEQGGFGIIV
jgi:hypothetical protein